MSTDSNDYNQSGSDSPYERNTAPDPSKRSEIKLISHSDLLYWWPVWFSAFVLAGFTYFEGNRMAIVPEESKLVAVDPPRGVYDLEIDVDKSKIKRQEYYSDAAFRSGKGEPAFESHMSRRIWLGSVFGVILILTIIITNIPLRGLWSFLVLIMIAVIALVITVFDAWDGVLALMGGLHIHINLAGYLFIGTAVFIIWALAVFVFDRRSYIIFTPGMIRYCEHIGASVEAYSPLGVSLVKQRDDLFRHYILGFGSGDLILKLGRDKHQDIRLPNVLGIGWRLPKVERILATMATTD